MKKITIIIGIIIIVALVGIGLYKNTHKQKQTLQEMSVATMPSIGTSLVHIANDKGYFTEHGLKVTLMLMATGDEAAKAVATHSVDVATPGLVPYSFLAISNPDMKVFGVIADAHDTKVIARKDKGITTAQDLKGKIVAYSKNTAADIGMDRFLAANNMTLKDIQLVDLKPLAMPNALESGQIDAYMTWEPFLLNGEKALGDKAILLDRPDEVYTWQNGLVASDTYIKSHQDTLKRFVAALSEAQALVDQHKEEAIAIAATRAKLPLESMSQVWPEYDFVVRPAKSAVAVLQDDLTWANTKLESKIKNPPKAEDVISESIIP